MVKRGFKSKIAIQPDNPSDFFIAKTVNTYQMQFLLSNTKITNPGRILVRHVFSTLALNHTPDKRIETGSTYVLLQPTQES